MAQEDSLSTIELEEVQIKASGIETSYLSQARSISIFRAPELQESMQQLSMHDYLQNVPGLFSMNAHNYAQDMRISIRGFGARSAFGIRGITILMDGIPLTTPDGQGQVDNINPGMIESIEILKGPAAALYGNASGGVIKINTKKSLKDNYLGADVTLGSYGMQKYQAEAGYKSGNTVTILNAAYTALDGYRNHSKHRNYSISGRVSHDFSEDSNLKLQFNLTHSPQSQDPGGITRESLEVNRKQASERNVDFNAGENISQIQAGLRYSITLDKSNSLNFNGFYSYRTYEGRIPLQEGGWIDLDRNYFGQSTYYQNQNSLIGGKNTLRLGYNIAYQNDRRVRFNNNQGIKGEEVLNQNEIFSTAGFYVLNNFEINRLLISASLRYDIHDLKAEDKLLDDGDQSGSRKLSSLNPGIGLNFRVAKGLFFYSNFRTSFETPSLSELSANPDAMMAGFNQNLNSQRAQNFEVGLRGKWSNFKFDFTGFHIRTENDIIPFESPDNPGRVFYRNAGSTVRNGIETMLAYNFTEHISINGSYTFSDFRYEEYTSGSSDFEDNLLPAIPKNYLTLRLAFIQDCGFTMSLEHIISDFMYANDANTELVPMYQVTNFRIRYKKSVGNSDFIFFGGIKNIFSSEYNSNIRLNAFGGRYYEAAPTRNIYGGIRWKIFDRN